MKAIKYLFLGALTLSFSAPVAAQEESPVEAVKALIESNAPDAEKQIKSIYKKNKKNPEVVVGIGRAYYEAKDTANARIYGEYGAKMNYGPAYILLGDITALSDDGGGAAKMYDQAIYFDPKNPDAYYKYASVYRKVSPAGAAAKLEELRSQRPDLPVDALKGRILYLANEFEDAITAFEKADRSKMEERDLRSFAMAYYLTGKHQPSFEIAEYALTKSPRDAGFNRLAFFTSTDLKNYEKALDYADRLFNKSDSAKFTYFDYSYFGNALNGAKRHDEAIAAYKKALEQEFDSNDKRAGVIKQLADAYKGVDDYENAVKFYDQYLKEVSKASLNDYADLGRLYVQYADKLEGDDKMEKLKKADEIYADLAAKNEDAKEYSLFWRGRVNTMMDPESKDGLAKPYYEELANTINAKAEKDKADQARLIESCRYLINFYINVASDTPKAKEYAQMLLSVDPENEIGKMVMELKD
jgi:tetratricopeptide (TPR) repeat protein